MKEYQVGNTIRFEVEFRDWDLNQTLVDPTTIKFSILDIRFNKLSEIVVGAEGKISQGKYFTVFVPEMSGTFYYEWSATIDELPSVYRNEFKVVEVL